MPRKTDIATIDNKFLDRRIKLLDCQKESAIRLYSEGMSINAIARMFKVNKRAIQFILFPERLKKNIADRKARGGSKQYYNKEKNTATIKEHRDYKKSLTIKNLKTNENK